MDRKHVSSIQYIYYIREIMGDATDRESKVMKNTFKILADNNNSEYLVYFFFTIFSEETRSAS